MQPNVLIFVPCTSERFRPVCISCKSEKYTGDKIYDKGCEGECVQTKGQGSTRLYNYSSWNERKKLVQHFYCMLHASLGKVEGLIYKHGEHVRVRSLCVVSATTDCIC